MFASSTPWGPAIGEITNPPSGSPSERSEEASASSTCFDPTRPVAMSRDRGGSGSDPGGASIEGRAACPHAANPSPRADATATQRHARFRYAHNEKTFATQASPLTIGSPAANPQQTRSTHRRCPGGAGFGPWPPSPFLPRPVNNHTRTHSARTPGQPLPRVDARHPNRCAPCQLRPPSASELQKVTTWFRRRAGHTECTYSGAPER